MLTTDDLIKEPGEPITDRFAVSEYPTMLLIDKSGKIVYRNEGYSLKEMKKLDALIQSSINN
jgi:hypothetical protein